MHTVVASECTGCELCVPACPVDCIALIPMPFPGKGGEDRSADPDTFVRAWMAERAPRARARFERRAARRASRRKAPRDREAGALAGADRAAVVAAAVARVRERRRAAGRGRR